MLKKILKFNFKILFFVFCIYIFSNNVFAKVNFYFCNGSTIHYNTNFELGSGRTTSIKYTSSTKDCKNMINYAYCGSETAWGYVASNLGYKRDKSWSDASTCGYNVQFLKDAKGNWTNSRCDTGKEKNCHWRHFNDGDCSVVLGYVIKKGLDTGQYFRALTSNWTYLAAFTPSPYKDYNNTPSGTNAKPWKNNSTIKGVLRAAWNSYYDNYHSKTTSTDRESTVTENIYTLSGDKTLYYVPDNDCGKGYYISPEITLTLNSSVPINIPVTIEFSFDNSNVEIVSDNAINDSFTLMNKSGQNTVKFRLKSAVYISKFTMNTLATYETEKTINTSIKYYDTTRYTQKNQSPRTNQNMIVMTKVKDSDSSTLTVTHIDDEDFVFDVKSVSLATCPTGYTTSSNGNYYYGSNSLRDKSCAHSYRDNLKSNENKYTSNYQGCRCLVFEKDNKKTRVIVQEKTKIIFGTFNPDHVYPAGGFALSNNNTSTQLKSTYATEVLWKYADSINGVPYYYNTSDKKGHTENNFNISDIERKVSLTLKNNVDLKISTKDSNDGSKDVDITVPIKLDWNISSDYANKRFYKQVDISLNRAWFSSNGLVKYSDKSDNTYKVDGYRVYYVPRNYLNDSIKNGIFTLDFPFNIRNVSDSVSSSYFNFYLSANCSIPVGDDGTGEPGSLIYNYRYRPIAVDDPFPTGNIPINWKQWISSPSNVARLMGTYNKKYIYKISLNSQTVSNIIKYNNDKLYTNWDTVSKETGVNSFLNSFEKNNANSYCRLGIFNDDCDQ